MDTYQLYASFFDAFYCKFDLTIKYMTVKIGIYKPVQMFHFKV